jgi:CHC2 zinc finger
MNCHHFDGKQNAELRAKIDEAKRRVPMAALMARPDVGLAAHAKKEAHCPWHSDEHASFSVFKKADGNWWHKCFVGCSEGDEIALLMKHFGLSEREAITRYLDMAGFPSSRSHNSHESPESREYPQFPESRGFPRCHESPVSPVSPMSNGQGLERALKALAARNVCTEHNDERERCWKLLRDLRAVEKGIGQELTIDELMVVFAEWHRLSESFLDSTKTRDAYLAAFLAKLRKVRVPSGEGDTLNKAREAVSKLAPSELQMIPGMLDAPESWRRLLALHSELSSRSPRKNKTYFLSYRDAAKAHNGLSHQLAYDITLAFERLGFIKIVDKGKAGATGGKAAEFRYLLPQTGNGTSQTENRAGVEACPPEEPPF